MYLNTGATDRELRGSEENAMQPRHARSIVARGTIALAGRSFRMLWLCIMLGLWQSGALAQTTPAAVTLSATPSTVIEGDGVVDIVIKASVMEAVTGSDLEITLAIDPSSTATDVGAEPDYEVVGHASYVAGDLGANLPYRVDSGLPTITVPVGSTTPSRWAVLQLRVPAGADSESETIVLTGSTTDTNYTVSDNVTITISADQLGANEERLAQKHLMLVRDGPTLGWDGGYDFSASDSFISSNAFEAAEEQYWFSYIVRSRDNGPELRTNLSEPLPDAGNMLLRFYVGDAVTSVRFHDATSVTTFNFVDDIYVTRYTWNNTNMASLSLPNIASGVGFDFAVIREEVDTAFDSSAAIMDQTWYRGETVELSLPRVTAGNAPVTYELDVTPTGLALYEAGDTIPSEVTCTVDLPAICGTVTAEFPTTTITYTATDDDGEDAMLTFSANVPTNPPTGLRFTRVVGGFRMSWEPPEVVNPAVAVSSYRIEFDTSENFPISFDGRVEDHSSTTYTDTGYATEDYGLVWAYYRVRANSNAGTSRPHPSDLEDAYAGIVTNTPPPPAVTDLRATATGPRAIDLSWTAPEDNGVEVTGYRVQRTTESDPSDSDWTSLTASTGTGTGYSDTSEALCAGTDYYYQVAATSANGDADWSKTAMVTLGPPGTVPLTVALAGGPNVGPDITVAATFTAPIDPTTFTVADNDIVATNATVTNIRSSIVSGHANRVFLVDLTATMAGAVTVQIPALAVETADTAVCNRASETLTVTADFTPPVATITLTPDTTTHVTGDFGITVSFDEGIGESFTISDIQASGGARPSNFAVTTAGMVYTADIIPSAADGELTVTIPAGAAMDAAGLGNAAVTRTVTVDRASPTISFPNAPTATSAAFDLTIRFTNGPVTSFDGTMITTDATGATVGSLATVTEGVEYTVNISVPSGDTSMTITVAANAARDAAGNGNPVASHMVAVDTAAPTISSIVSDPTGNVTGPVALTISFNEKVYGLDGGEVTFTGSAATGINLTETSTGTDPSVFTMDVTPSADGTLTVGIAAGAAMDAAGNGNVANTQDFTVALAAPTVTIAASSGTTVGGKTYINSATFSFTLTFSGAVSGLRGGDLVVTNGGLTNFTGSGTSYTATTISFAPAGRDEFVVTAMVPADAATATAAGMAGNAASPTYMFNVDLGAPGVRIEGPGRASVNGAFTVSVVFDEPVSGFAVDDLVVVNGTKGTLSGTAPTDVYTTTVTPVADGDVTMNIAAGVAMDVATNTNTAAEELVVVADTVRPAIMNSSSDSPATVMGTFDIAVTFTEPVRGFTATDLTVTNGTAGEPVPAADRTTFTVTITPTADSAVSVELQADAVADDAGNRGPTTNSNLLTRTAMLPDLPGKPSGLQATGGQQAIWLSWTAPDSGGTGITGYGIEVSDNGELGSWRELVANTGNPDTNYRHAGVAGGQTKYYQLHAINVSGRGVTSEAATGTTSAPVSSTTTDGDGDGQVTAVDAVIWYMLESNLPETELQSLLRPLAPPGQDFAAWFTAVSNTATSATGRDINGDGSTNAADFQLLYHVKEFPELVGNGTVGSGFAEFRRQLILLYTAPGTPQTDAEARRMIRVVQGF